MKRGDMVRLKRTGAVVVVFYERDGMVYYDIGDPVFCGATSIDNVETYHWPCPMSHDKEAGP